MSDTPTYDVQSFDIVTDAIMELLNDFPGLSTGEKIAYAMLGDTQGIAMFPVSGAVVESDVVDIIGHETQICLYPFYVIYRAYGLSESNKAKAKEWLDRLGSWLEKQTITVGESTYKLDSYPELSGDREFLSVKRQNPAHLDSVNDNMSENWAISISARYRNEFDL